MWRHHHAGKNITELWLFVMAWRLLWWRRLLTTWFPIKTKPRFYFQRKQCAYNNRIGKRIKTLSIARQKNIHWTPTRLIPLNYSKITHFPKPSSTRHIVTQNTSTTNISPSTYSKITKSPKINHSDKSPKETLKTPFIH